MKIQQQAEVSSSLKQIFGSSGFCIDKKVTVVSLISIYSIYIYIYIYILYL